MLQELPEEKMMFKEKLELEQTEDQSDDPFVPAKLTKMDKEGAYVYVELN